MLTRCDEILDNFEWNTTVLKKERTWVNKGQNKTDKNTKAGKTMKTDEDFKITSGNYRTWK